MVRIFLITFTVILFLSPLALASDVSSECKKIERDLHLLYDEYHIERAFGIQSCKELEKIIPSKEIEELLLKNSQINDGPKKIMINSCEDLKELKIDYLHSRYNEEGVFKKYFGQDLKNWSNSDFDYLVNYLNDCRSKNFFSRYDKNYFSKLVLKESAELQKRHIKEKRLFAIRDTLKKAEANAQLKAQLNAKQKKEQISKKYANAGPEDGWKNLKWGMTLEEIKTVGIEGCEKIHVDEPVSLSNGFFCYEVDKCLNIYSYIEIEKKLQEITCGSGSRSSGDISTGIILFDGKFFGAIINMPDYLREKENFMVVIKQLGEKFSKGKIRQKDGQGPINQYKYPSFEYNSDHIKVFNDDNELFFYDSKVLKEILGLPARIESERKNQENKRLKKLF